jgi:hypothetical protein
MQDQGLTQPRPKVKPGKYAIACPPLISISISISAYIYSRTKSPRLEFHSQLHLHPGINYTLNSSLISSACAMPARYHLVYIIADDG